MNTIDFRPTQLYATYWRDGLRWKVVLQVMYPHPAGGAGGPFFPHRPCVEQGNGASHGR